MPVVLLTGDGEAETQAEEEKELQVVKFGCGVGGDLGPARAAGLWAVGWGTGGGDKAVGGGV